MMKWDVRFAVYLASEWPPAAGGSSHYFAVFPCCTSNRAKVRLLFDVGNLAVV